MSHTPEALLAGLLTATPRPTSEAPRNARGVYGLVDHLGALRYIGSTSSAAETLYKRIHQRHHTGSENTSHYFSRMYNTGRMWRDRDAPRDRGAKIAKDLRSAFIADHCAAVWVPLDDTLDIAGLEARVIAIAPSVATAWNRNGMTPYSEPEDLVDATLRRLGWGAEELAALELQRARFADKGVPTPQRRTAATGSAVPPFPTGPFRFFALDVETANNDRGSICQIGVACVRPDNTTETWVTHVDPRTAVWRFSDLHGITADTVRGAPVFAEVLPVLVDALKGAIVYQHSSFDRSAVAAASAHAGLPVPDWQWRDSVQVARAAWPDLKRNGGHGLASLKVHLGLDFEHHDAGEDARAAAEVVLHAEAARPATTSARPFATDALDVIDDEDYGPACTAAAKAPVSASIAATTRSAGRQIGVATITQANIDYDHIYLGSFFEAFPSDVIGGSNKAAAAPRMITVDWGGAAPVATDLDSKKKFFRSRGWTRTFFERNGAVAGDRVAVHEIAPYSYRVTLMPR